MLIKLLTTTVNGITINTLFMLSLFTRTTSHNHFSQPLHFTTTSHNHFSTRFAKDFVHGDESLKAQATFKLSLQWLYTQYLSLDLN